MYCLFVIFFVLGGTISEIIIEKKSSKEDDPLAGNTKPALPKDIPQLDTNLENIKGADVSDANLPPPDNITIQPQAEAYIFHPQEGELLEAAARGAAQLVSAGLQMTPGGGPQEPQGLMARLISLLGLDPSKLAAVAINGIIMMAQLISNTLTGFKPSEQTPPSGDPAAWIFANSPVEARQLVKEATDTRLGDRLIESVRDSSGLATDCIELLLCKCTPMIGAMQTALSQSPPPGWSRLSPVRRMYSYFPRLETVARHSTACDVRFPACRLKYSYHDDL